MLQSIPPFWLVVLILGLYWLSAPLGTWAQSRFAGNPEYKAVEMEKLDQITLESLLVRTKPFVELGFDQMHLISVTGLVPGTVMYLMILANRQSGDTASVSDITAWGWNPVQTSFMEFNTRLDTGHDFSTDNACELPGFPADPTKFRTQLPTIAEPKRLYAIHKLVVSRHGATGKKIRYEPDKALEWVESSFKKFFGNQVARGWLRYSPTDDTYRYTLKGAYLKALGHMQPFKALREMALRLREKRVLKEFAAAGQS